MRIFHYECLPERVTLFTLQIPRNLLEENFNHKSGRGSVCKLLSQSKQLVGFVDHDPQASSHGPYFKSLFSNYISDKFSVRHSFDSKRSNHLIIIKPRYEEWLITAANTQGILLRNHKLSDDPNELHGMIPNQVTDLQKFLHFLIKKKNPSLLHLMDIAHVCK